MNPRRKSLISQAFSVLDKDNSGFIEPQDLVSCYDTSKHPDVLAGKKTPDAVLREFLDTFDVGGEVDGKVTRNEFENYYHNISASIDNDDYFELMIRNAWHISGGEGWAANSAKRRVLVTDSRGNQSVQEIKNDLGLKADDKAGMIARLKAQGVDVSSISLTDGVDNKSKPKKMSADKIVSRFNPPAQDQGLSATRNLSALVGGVSSAEASIASKGPSAPNPTANNAVKFISFHFISFHFSPLPPYYLNCLAPFFECEK